MPDYANTVIYKICCKNTDITDIYVGHTTNIKKRIRHHKNTCKNPKNNRYHLKVYEFIRNNGGFDNWNIIVLEEYPCNSFSDAIIKEREYYETLKPTLNMIYPQRTNKEYIIDNIEYYNQYGKQYRIDNKEYYNEYVKQYRIDNKEYTKEYIKQYRNDNKEKIKEKAKKKVMCDICNIELCQYSIHKHQKSAKHLSNLSI